MSSTYDFAEPGFILIDKVNEMNKPFWKMSERQTHAENNHSPIRKLSFDRLIFVNFREPTKNAASTGTIFQRL